MFTPESIRSLIFSAQECDTFESFCAEEGGALPDDASYADGSAEQILRVIWDGRDGGISPLAVRSLSGLSRAEYSRRYSIPVRTVENWECDGANAHRCPEYVSLLLLSDVLNRIFCEE